MIINPDLQPGKPVQTRSGLEAVVYAVYEGQEYPVHGAYRDKDGVWMPTMYHGDGSFWWDHGPHALDIIPVPKKLTGFYQEGREHAIQELIEKALGSEADNYKSYDGYVAEWLKSQMEENEDE